MTWFERNGIRFFQPEDWTVETQDNDDGWAITLQSEGSAFVLVNYIADEEDPARLADQALEDLRGIYPDLEAVDVMESIAGQPAIGYDVEFFTLDFDTVVRLRAFSAPDGCVLFTCQRIDAERGELDNEMRRIVASLQFLMP